MKKKLPVIIATSYLVIYSPILVLSFIPFFYRFLFNLLGVYSTFSSLDISKEVLDFELNQLIFYMHSLSSRLDENFFSQVDVLHMRDVRGLFLIFNIIFIICAAFIIYLLETKKKELVTANLKTSGLVVLLFVAIVGIISFANFDGAFITFHKLFFRNDYWMLDPGQSNIIKMFPQEFFEWFVGVSLGVSGMVAIIFAIPHLLRDLGAAVLKNSIR